MFRRILVATDGTAESNHAVSEAVALAKRLGATLTVFHASPSYEPLYFSEGAGLGWPPKKQYWEEASATADKLLKRAKAVAEKQDVETTLEHASSNSPAQAIIAAATKSKADLIVMASHGRRGLTKLLLGSETQKVLALTTLPVLVTRRKSSRSRR